MNKRLFLALASMFGAVAMAEPEAEVVYRMNKKVETNTTVLVSAERRWMENKEGETRQTYSKDVVGANQKLSKNISVFAGLYAQKIGETESAGLSFVPGGKIDLYSLSLGTKLVAEYDLMHDGGLWLKPGVSIGRSFLDKRLAPYVFYKGFFNDFDHKEDRFGVGVNAVLAEVKGDGAEMPYSVSLELIASDRNFTERGPKDRAMYSAFLKVGF